MGEYKNDIEYIYDVKKFSDNGALKELISRHSGIYIEMVNRMMQASHSDIVKSEVLNEKDSFIYQCAMKYDPDINIKFSTFVGNQIRWKCMNIYNSSKRRHFEEFDPTKSFSGHDLGKIENDEIMAKIKDILIQYPDKRARKIFLLRYIDGQQNKVMPWKKIAEKLDMSIQGCINIHDKLIKYIQVKL